MRFFLHLFFLLLPSFLFSQNLSGKFKKLSRPEKCWVYFHPFVAKKAFLTTRQVRADVDSVKRSGIIGTDQNGGKLDAFRHSYWMLSLSLSIGSRKALKLGKAHEKGNYLEFKKHRPEDSILPDSVSSEMDLRNNAAGIASAGNCRTFRSKSEVQNVILKALEHGDLFIIKKDRQGNYLYCDKTFIDMNFWQGKWNIPKCLVASNSEQ